MNFDKHSVNKYFKNKKTGEILRCIAFSSRPSVSLVSDLDANNRIDFCIGSPVSEQWEEYVEGK